ncbi:hypothetical protein C922_00984 [Plasmodium inui San Antonio 1]|uniref:Troponin c-like protein n=1 Tax=Plasmodium inui San Antonio 1 TaxID=1237626 RepID=W7AA50_9APIC|nr:hypothetical protein C922_00984 [Plasmodium inui San Antonio 1]EUD68585.1 hypothetical protein C922_00984 [Plasmodium inui San Antonio 1]
MEVPLNTPTQDCHAHAMSCELASEVELTSLFNKLSDGSKNVNIENALQIVYKLGYVPSKEDIDEFMHTTNGICSLSNIKKFCKKLKLFSVSTDGLVDVFSHYDVHLQFQHTCGHNIWCFYFSFIVKKKRTGKISKDQFKSLFTTVGSRMSNAEMDAIIRELCNKADQIDYKEFLSK